ncbi:unnamed protein product [Acanthoscelides obtectus]|uniref:Transposase n=1 Tax=Acanthoscelides obtectus TaxID=200917 RepID=A0A9P0PPK1_ACAOB|nr:unnamed protein product [Acanthoscelides obtectus]CAK1663294.1 hypothetical protein AOBTE_LOCUS23599 [Acanthoscelides obtectus]
MNRVQDMSRQLSQQECLAELLSVFGNEAPHQSTISRWYGEFKHGRVSLSDDPRIGAPKTAVTQENVDAVRKLIIEDRHVTYREIEASLKISIVSGDESWIYCYESENKRQSAVWVIQGEEKPTKVIRSRSVSKKMVATFVYTNPRTVTADWYTTIFLPKVITELRKINPERRIILHQDNASSHTFRSKLRGQRFQSPEEAVDAFKNAVLDLPANEWNKCFENWFERMQMCNYLRGEYLEKQ